MNIGIDGNEANTKNRVGINTYAYELLHHIYKQTLEKTNKNKYTIYLKNSPHNHLPKENKSWKYKVLKSKRLWILTKLTPYLRRNLDNINVFFTPTHYIPPFVSIPVIFSVMDLGYLENTDQFRRYDYWQLKYWTAYSMSRSKRIISISGQTERDIVRHYPFASMKTFVTHLGYDYDSFNLDYNKRKINDVRNKYSIVNDYILFMSTLKPSKNIERLIKSWAGIASKYKNVQLVIAGKKGWLYESIYNTAKELNILDRIVFTGFIDEDDKQHLIKGAKAFALPSLWEGFGLDVLSSLASGVPAIISDVGSLPEVGGEAAIYVDPNDTASIADAISKVLSMSEKDYNSLRTAGLKQVGKFSWDKTAKQTIEIIENAL